MDSQDALAAQLVTSGSESKKFRMTVMGLLAVLFVFMNTAIAYMLNPAALAPLLSFAQATVVGIGGMVAVYSGAQAAVDWRTTAALSK